MLFGRKPFIIKREETIPCPNLLPCQKDYCCCCSVAKSCMTICGPMDCSIPGFPVLHYLPEFAQIRVHWVSDAIQPSHPLPSPPPPFNLSQHQRVFTQQVAKVWVSASALVTTSNEYSGLIFFRIAWFDLLAAPGTLESSAGPQFESINFLALSLLYGPVLTFVHDYWKNHRFDYTDLCRQSDVSAF